MPGLGDFFAAIANRLGQQAQATQQGTLGLGPDPNAGRAINYGGLPPWLALPLRLPITALQGAGLVNEAAQNVGRMGTGTVGAGLGALQNALNSPFGGAVGALAHTAPVLGSVADALQIGQHLGPLNPMAVGPLKTADAQRALAAFMADPGIQGELAANEALAQGNKYATGAANLALNPLNALGPLGDVAATMRLAQPGLDALGGATTVSQPAAIRALGLALQGARGVGEFGNAPATAVFAGLGQGLTRGPLAGLRAAGGALGGDALRGLADDLAGALQRPGRPGIPQPLGPSAVPYGPPVPIPQGPPAPLPGGGFAAGVPFTDPQQIGVTPGNVPRSAMPLIGGAPGLGPSLPPQLQPIASVPGNVPISRMPAIGGAPGLGPELPPQLQPIASVPGNVPGRLGPLGPPLAPELMPIASRPGNVPQGVLGPRLPAGSVPPALPPELQPIASIRGNVPKAQGPLGPALPPELQPAVSRPGNVPRGQLGPPAPGRTTVPPTRWPTPTAPALPDPTESLADLLGGAAPPTAAAPPVGPLEAFLGDTAASYRTPTVPPVSEALSASQGLPEAGTPALHPAVLNPDGSPKVFYHGTTGDFTEYRPGTYFSPDVAGAEPHALDKTRRGYPLAERLTGANIRPVYLDVTNPVNLKDIPRRVKFGGMPEMIDWAKANGYDGIIDDYPAAVVNVDAAQVHSAIGAPAAIPEAAAPAAAAATNWADRAGVIRQVANAPLAHLNSVLADLHNALYPGRQADFAIPSLTGQPKAAFRTSMLTDAAGQNRAEPYLDYLLNRVQKDPAAATRLADINPTLADEATRLATTDIAPEAHKAAIQALFKGPPGTLDDFNALLAGKWSTSMYLPPEGAFAKELGVPIAQARQWIDDAIAGGTLARDSTGQLTFAPKGPGAAAAGDIAAGGGGGDGLGLIPPRLPQTLGGAVAGGVVGAGVGAAADEDNRLRGALKGAGLGVLAGGGLGSGIPDAYAAPLGAIAKEGVAATREAAVTGERGLFPKGGLGVPYIRALRKTGLFVVPRNALGAMGNVVMGGGDLPQALRYAGEFWQNMPTLLPALRAAGSDEAAKAAAMYAALPADLQQYGEQGIATLMGHSGSAYERNAADLGAANVHPLAGALRGGILAGFSPRTAVIGAPSLALGAVEGATLPARAAIQNALTTEIDVPARLALSFPAYQEGLAAEAPGFIAKVAAVDPALAATLDPTGKFDPSAIVPSAAPGSRAAVGLPALADEWAGVQEAVAQHAGGIATDRMGDFTSPGRAAGLLNAIFPGGVWNMQQAAVLARAAADHPALAFAALNAMRQDYEAHVQRGDPQHAGTWELTDKTPGFGALVRLANGGGPGSFYVNPAYPFSPFSGETLNLPRELDPRLNPNQTLYDRAMKVGSALGLAVNPEIQMVAYKEGASSTPMTTPLRLEPVGQYLDAKTGLGLTANPLAQGLDPQGSVANMEDINLQLRRGQYLDPAVARAGAELIYEQTGRPASDPSNAPLLAQLRDHSTPLYQQAEARGLGGKAALAGINEALPVSGQAEGQTAGDVARAQMQLFARGIPPTRALITALNSGDMTTASMAVQAALDRAKLANPLLAVNDAATPIAQAQALASDFIRQNRGLQGLWPELFNVAYQAQQERLGLVPAGTMAGLQQQMDWRNAGLQPGGYMIGPGMPMPDYSNAAEGVRQLMRDRLAGR